MMPFTRAESDFVNRAYEQATTRVENLDESNRKLHSDIRQIAIDDLQAHQERIENLGFFEKTDFSVEEIKAIVDAGGELDAAEASMDDTHELTLMELETDLANVVQKVVLNEYLPFLKAYWAYAKRYARFAADQIPEEVSDDYNVGVFNRVQVRLNQIAFKVRDVSQRRCLNSDDYGSESFTVAVLEACRVSAEDATYNYIALQKLKEAARANKAAREISLRGRIWDLFGWDSPSDFVWDVVLAASTGGVSKVVRWGRRLKRMTGTTSKTLTKLETLLAIEKRTDGLQARLVEVQRAAERLKKAKNVVQLPRKIERFFNLLNKANEQRALLEQVGQRVSSDYIRGVVSSVAAKWSVTGSPQLGRVAAKEVARASILDYLDGTPLGKEIRDTRANIKFTLLIESGYERANHGLLMKYFALLIAREFVARMAISAIQKRALTAEQVVNEFIDSAASALETMLLDIPFISENQLKSLARTIMSTIRKVLAEIAKKIVDDKLLVSMQAETKWYLTKD